MSDPAHLRLLYEHINSHIRRVYTALSLPSNICKGTLPAVILYTNGGPFDSSTKWQEVHSMQTVPALLGKSKRILCNHTYLDIYQSADPSISSEMGYNAVNNVSHRNCHALARPWLAPDLRVGLLTVNCSAVELESSDCTGRQTPALSSLSTNITAM